MKQTWNFHTHTTFCDGRDTPEAMAEAACALGFTALGFSGHSYLPFDDSWCMRPADEIAYRQAVAALKEQYRGTMEIFCGIEQDYFSGRAAEGYDYVIGSVHCLPCGDGFCSVDSSAQELARLVRSQFGGDAYAMAEQYYAMVGRIVEQTGAQIVGHFDLITKFIEQQPLFDPHAPRYLAAATAALERLIADGAVFEVNTGAMARGYRTAPYPDPVLLRQICRMGGRVMVNSDCHNKAHLAFGFDQARKLVADCGFHQTGVWTQNGLAMLPL